MMRLIAMCMEMMPFFVWPLSELDVTKKVIDSFGGYLQQAWLGTKCAKLIGYNK